MGDPFDPEFTKLLVCPKCKEPVELRQDLSGFFCRNCKLLFKVEGNIPNFIIEQAHRWEEPHGNG